MAEPVFGRRFTVRSGPSMGTGSRGSSSVDQWARPSRRLVGSHRGMVRGLRQLVCVRGWSFQLTSASAPEMPRARGGTQEGLLGLLPFLDWGASGPETPSG